MYVLPGLANIHKPSQRQHDPFLDQRDRSLQFGPRVVLRFGVARGGVVALTEENVHDTLS